MTIHCDPPQKPISECEVKRAEQRLRGLGDWDTTEWRRDRRVINDYKFASTQVVYAR